MDRNRALQTYDLLLPVFEAMNRQIEVTSIAALSANEWQIFTCNTLWVTKSFTVEIAGNNYKVTDIEHNQWIKVRSTVTPPIAPVATVFNANEPYFVHGTLHSVNLDNTGKKAFYDKYPMLWLHDITNERNDRNDENLVGRYSDCDFFCLISSKNEEWATLDHDKYAIKPARNLLKSFLDALLAARITALDTGTIQAFYEDQTRDHARFGKYLNAGNASKNVAKEFADDVSGTHLKISIPFYKTYCCTDCCERPALGGGIVQIRNTNDTFTDSQVAPGTYTIPNTDVDVYIDGVLNQSVSVVTLDPAAEINIDL